MAMTPAERKRAQRERDRAEGLREYNVKIPDTPEACERLKRYAKKLRMEYLTEDQANVVRQHLGELPKGCKIFNGREK